MRLMYYSFSVHAAIYRTLNQFHRTIFNQGKFVWQVYKISLFNCRIHESNILIMQHRNFVLCICNKIRVVVTFLLYTLHYDVSIMHINV